MPKQLGEMLVAGGIISRKTLERALARQQGSGKRLGQVLEEMGVVTEDEVMLAVESQMSPFADAGQRRQLGDLLVETGIISEKTVERALARSKAEGKRVGQTLTEMGVITEEELVDALGRQFNFKTIKAFASRGFAPELLNLLPTEFVMKRAVFPLMQKEFQLAVAMADPFDSETSDMIARITGLQLVPVIATRSEIMEAVARHYLHASASTENVAQDTILVVEDSPTVASLIQSALAKEGYHVLLATDGLEALKLVLIQRPCLVITDALMPRLDGHGLLRAIKANPLTAGIPVIMLTGKASTDEEQKALAAGFFDFIPKPVQPLRIISRAKRALEFTRSLKAA